MPHLTPTSPVGDARLLLARTHAHALVVEDDGGPVGVVTARALIGRRPPADATAPVSTVMDHETVRIPPTAGERETMRTYVRAAWTSLRRRRPYGARPDAHAPPEEA